jgi:hypothetical protein
VDGISGAPFLTLDGHRAIQSEPRPPSSHPEADDGSQVGPLLEQIAGPVASFTGDGAYDRDDVYREVCQRHPDAAVIVPPRSSAVPSATAETAPTKRDRHLQLIAERGRMGWSLAAPTRAAWGAPGVRTASMQPKGSTGTREIRR